MFPATSSVNGHSVHCPPASRRVPHREVRKHTTYLITKKCADDLFLTRPSQSINQTLLYLLLLKARRYGLLIHGYCFLSNHFHLVLTDVHGRLPSFMREFLGESSKAVQVITRGDRAIWSRKRYSAVELLDLDAAERKLTYTLLNPTRAGLTRPEDWPGLTSAIVATGSTVIVERPDAYFSAKRPRSVELALTPLTAGFQTRVCAPGKTGSAQQRAAAEEASNQRVRERTHSELEDCLTKLKRAGRALRGSKAVLRASRDSRGQRRVRHLRPRFASRDAEVIAGAIRRSKRFEADHEKARRRYVAGEQLVQFPAGTYGYRVLLGVRVREETNAA